MATADSYQVCPLPCPPTHNHSSNHDTYMANSHGSGNNVLREDPLQEPPEIIILDISIGVCKLSRVSGLIMCSRLTHKLTFSPQDRARLSGVLEAQRWATAIAGTDMHGCCRADAGMGAGGASGLNRMSTHLSTPVFSTDCVVHSAGSRGWRAHMKLLDSLPVSD